MKYWVGADSHLGHFKMAEEEYGLRPIGYEETILKNLKNNVGASDVYIDLGDICYYRMEYWHERLEEALGEAKRWLLRGNHDKKSNGWYLSHGWDVVAESILISAYGKRILLSHRPVTGCSDYFDVNVHGHHHNTLHHPEDETTDKHRLVFPEHHYLPTDLRRIVERKGSK